MLTVKRGSRIRMRALVLAAAGVAFASFMLMEWYALANVPAPDAGVDIAQALVALLIGIAGMAAAGFVGGLRNVWPSQWKWAVAAAWVGGPYLHGLVFRGEVVPSRLGLPFLAAAGAGALLARGLTPRRGAVVGSVEGDTPAEDSEASTGMRGRDYGVGIVVGLLVQFLVFELLGGLVDTDAARTGWVAFVDLWGPWLAAAGVAVVLGVTHPRGGRLGLGVAIGTVMFYPVALAVIGVRGPLPDDGVPVGTRDAEVNLVTAAPDVWHYLGEFRSLDQFTAEFLNDFDYDPTRSGVKFVRADQPSLRAFTVSVNPIDTYTWGAAAYSEQYSTCFLIVIRYSDETVREPEYRFAEVPNGQPCVGSLATVERTRPDPNRYAGGSLTSEAGRK